MTASPELERAVAAALEEDSGVRQPITWPAGQKGGLFHAGRHYFLKRHAAEGLAMFEAESEALEALRATATVRVPRVIDCGQAGDTAYLLLEFLDLYGHPDRDPAALGAQLAALHRVTGPAFGWHRDNTLGLNPQPNQTDNDWIRFWNRRRLGFQLRLAAGNGHPELRDLCAPLIENAADFFAGYRPSASLLHGDLWSGNHGYLPGGEPVIFDPASYYGDRETDLAMSELFGGFHADFYHAYKAHFAPDPGYRVRRELYQLYHLLNHLNLFGAGYLESVRATASRLLSELG